jgi:hypothetical protein
MSATGGRSSVSGSELGRPVVYGDAERVVVLVEGLMRLVERQPGEVLADPGVTGSLRRLLETTRDRLGEGAYDDGPDGHHPIRGRRAR